MPPKGEKHMSKLPENHDVIIASKDFGLNNWDTSDLLIYKYELRKMSFKNPSYKVFLNTKEYSVHGFIDILCQEIASRPDADNYNSIGE